MRYTALVAGLLLLAATVPAVAQENTVQIHGFGGWSAGKTDHNLYLGGEPHGDYQTSDFSLNIAATIGDNIRIVAQGRVAEASRSETETDLSYAFAEYTVSNALRFRAGEVKLPFGNYGEIIHVGTLRPFLDAPQGVYGPIGLAGEDAYKGVGITGRRDVGKWGLSYDLYAGGMELNEFSVPELFLLGEPINNDTPTEHELTRKVLGSRVVFQAPIEGLDFGVSAYRGTEITDTGNRPRWVAAVHGEYLKEPWSIRAEAGHETVQRDLKVDGAYVEVARRLNEHWQIAGQLDNLTTALFDAPRPVAPSFLGHREAALGLNYWFGPSMVIKSSVHRVTGNRFAAPLPDDYASEVAAGTLHKTTTLMKFGVNFSF